MFEGLGTESPSFNPLKLSRTYGVRFPWGLWVFSPLPTAQRAVGRGEKGGAIPSHL